MLLPLTSRMPTEGRETRERREREGESDSERERESKVKTEEKEKKKNSKTPLVFSQIDREIALFFFSRCTPLDSSFSFPLALLCIT